MTDPTGKSATDWNAFSAAWNAASGRGPSENSTENLVDPGGLYGETGTTSAQATLGFCGGLNAEIGWLGGSDSSCLTRTLGSRDEIGFVTSAFLARGLGADAAGTLAYQVSNAADLQQLAGPFYVATGTVADFGGVTVAVFWSTPSNLFDTSVGGGLLRLPKTYGIEVGLSLGEGMSAGIGVSDTSVHELGGFEATAAKVFWDKVPIPVIGTALLLRDALQIIRARTAASH